MNFESDQLISLLREVDRTRLEHELAARLTGENFNVFNILRLSASEVRTHSAFIAELLDPRGSHGQGSIYLKLFLVRMKIEVGRFNPEKARVIVEHPIGPVDLEYATGGRIDLLLEDEEKHRIVIENKIYATDQEYQLLRYYHAFPKALIYYLTLDGGGPSQTSLGRVDFPWKSISYKEDLLGWLEDCHKASVSLPVIRETIFQYENLIKKLTNQATGDKVKDKVIELITEHPDLVDAVALMGEAWKEIIDDADTKFRQRMCEECPNCLLKLANGDCIERLWDSTEDGVIIGFRTIDSRSGSTCVRAAEYAENLRRITPSAQSPSPWDVGLYTPDEFQSCFYFRNLPKSTILSFYKNNAGLNDFVAKLVKKVEDVTAKLFPGAERSIESIQHP